MPIGGIWKRCLRVHSAYFTRTKEMRTMSFHFMLTFTSATSDRAHQNVLLLPNDWHGNRCQRIWWMRCTHCSETNAPCCARLMRLHRRAGDGQSIVVDGIIARTWCAAATVLCISVHCLAIHHHQMQITRCHMNTREFLNRETNNNNNTHYPQPKNCNN